MILQDVMFSFNSREPVQKHLMDCHQRDASKTSVRDDTASRRRHCQSQTASPLQPTPRIFTTRSGLHVNCVSHSSLALTIQKSRILPMLMIPVYLSSSSTIIIIIIIIIENHHDHHRHHHHHHHHVIVSIWTQVTFARAVFLTGFPSDFPY